MSNDSLRDGRVKNWFYLENDLLDREDLTIYEKTVYIVIARYVNGENKAFPSYETIAKKGSMAKVQAMRVVKSLTQKGLLKKEGRRNKDNEGSTSNLYTLLNPKPKDKNNDDKWYKGKNKFEFYNDLFNYSLKKISSDVGYKFKKSSASVYGITRSFFLNKKTYDLLHTIYKKSQELYKTLYGDYLSVGNFTELILYIYITENIDKKILNLFKFDFGIKKIT